MCPLIGSRMFNLPYHTQVAGLLGNQARFHVFR